MTAKEKNQNLRILSEFSPDLLTILNKNWQITYINKVLPGFDRASVIGTNILNYISPDYHEAYGEWLTLVFTTHEPLTKEVKVVGERGSEAYYRVQFIPLSGLGNEDLIYTVSTDITEQKKAEQALVKSEEQLKIQIQRMPVGHIMWSVDFKVLSWNPAAEKIFGYNEAEMIGRQPYGTIVPDIARPVVEEIWKRLLQGDATAHSTNSNITKAGKIITCEWANTPLRDNEGKITGVLSMITDVTNRQLAEQKLKISEERLSLAFRGAGDGMWDWNIATSEVFYSANWEEMFGFAPGEVPARIESMTPRVHPDDIAEMFERVNSYLKKETPVYSHELRMLHKDGSILWTLHRAAAVWDEQGNPVRMIGTTTDITKRKKAEVELKASEANLRDAQRIAKVGNFEFNLHTQEIKLSDEAYRIFDLEIGKPITI